MGTANCYDNNNKKDIIFKSRPIIDMHAYTIGVPAGGKNDIGTFNVNKDCEYFKIVCGADCNDPLVTSIDHAAVCLEFTIKYRDEEANEDKTICDTFYPKFFSENDDEDDSVIINAPGKVKTINVTAYNNEDVAIDLYDFVVYVAIKADVTPETVGENLSEFYNNGGQTTLVIPLVDELPDVNSVPDGYICRLSSID